MKKEDLWPIDGHNHHTISRDSIYENSTIASFLDSTRVNLVIASKGMGKTLLMRVKKKVIIDSEDDVMLIPINAAEFDEPKLHGTFSHSGYTGVPFWKDIWIVSMVLSILSHTEGLWENTEHRLFIGACYFKVSN